MLPLEAIESDAIRRRHDHGTLVRAAAGRMRAAADHEAVHRPGLPLCPSPGPRRASSPVPARRAARPPASAPGRLPAAPGAAGADRLPRSCTGGAAGGAAPAGGPPVLDQERLPVLRSRGRPELRRQRPDRYWHRVEEPPTTSGSSPSWRNARPKRTDVGGYRGRTTSPAPTAESRPAHAALHRVAAYIARGSNARERPAGEEIGMTYAADPTIFGEHLRLGHALSGLHNFSVRMLSNPAPSQRSRGRLVLREPGTPPQPPFPPRRRPVQGTGRRR